MICNFASSKKPSLVPFPSLLPFPPSHFLHCTVLYCTVLYTSGEVRPGFILLMLTCVESLTDLSENEFPTRDSPTRLPPVRPMTAPRGSWPPLIGPALAAALTCDVTRSGLLTADYRVHVDTAVHCTSVQVEGWGIDRSSDAMKFYFNK